MTDIQSNPVFTNDVAETIKNIKIKVKNNHFESYENGYGIDFKIQKNWVMIKGKMSVIYHYPDERGVDRVYFYTGDLKELASLLRLLPENCVLEYICKGDNPVEETIIDGNFCKVTKHIRKVSEIRRDGKEFLRSHSAEFDAYYDESIGEYAKEEDSREIEQLLLDNFDLVKDHIPTLNEIKEQIKKKEILIYKHKGNIGALYSYQIQGKRFYSNYSYNRMPAIVLYCLEKKAHNYVMAHYDVEMKYSWIDVRNEKSLRRNILGTDGVYNHIYQKKEVV